MGQGGFCSAPLRKSLPWATVAMRILVAMVSTRSGVGVIVAAEWLTS